MNELVELVGTVVNTGWLLYGAIAALSIGFYALDRRPRATAGDVRTGEEPAETTTHRAA